VLLSPFLRAALVRAPVRTNPRACSHLGFLTRDLIVVADGVVSSKIAEELTYEKEAAIAEAPEFLKEFTSAGIWTVYRFLFSSFV
jgi:hypothetical protein